MTLQDDIFGAIRRWPPWKQELYLRCSLAPQLGEQDVREVTDMLLGCGTGAPRSVAREDLPGADGGEDPMHIRSISGVCSVNLLAEGQTLAFKERGVNVVYGRNGAGKTGYTRIVKHAGRTLHRETVLANVADPASVGPRATITVVIGDTEHAVALDLAGPPPALIGRICVADPLAAQRYVTSDTEVDYAPAALASLSRLAEGLRAVREELGGRLERARPAPLDLRPFGQDTQVARLLSSLSASTTREAIVELSTLSAQELGLLEELRRKRGEIEARQAPKLRALAERSAESALRLAAELRSLFEALGPDAVAAERARVEDLRSAREAARAAAESFAGEPVPGVGSDAWRLLWQSARSFAEHQGLALPPGHERASCPLCMQELGPDARARLARFDEFVRAEISVQVQTAERALAQAHERLPDPRDVRARHAQVLGLLAQDAPQVADRSSRWIEEAQRVADHVRAGELHGLVPVDAPPVEPVQEWATERQAEAGQHAALEDAERRAEIHGALAELEARAELGARLLMVLVHLDALSEADRLKDALGKCGTSVLSTTITALSRRLIEADLQGALNRHLRALNFQGLAVEAKSKTVRGRPMVALRFKTVAGVPLDSVLSQGEQRRLALAMFLAEMEVLGEINPVVLDDPASSIDQEGRRHIARTLCALAGTRQVVVFSHELSFVQEIRRQADSDLPLHFQHVCRDGQTVGHVRAGLPWEGLTARQRRQALCERLAQVRGVHEAGELERYRLEVSDFCVMARSAFERAVEEELLGETVTRRDDVVHTRNLRKVVVEEESCALVDRGMDACSRWAHDQPLADGADPPTPQELREILDIYGELLDRARAARADRDRERRGRLAVLDPTGELTAERPALRVVEADPQDGQARKPA